MERDTAISVTVSFFSGKRQSPPSLRSEIYCPHLMVKHDDEYLGVCFIDGPAEYEFDTLVRAAVLPIYEGVNYSKLEVNTIFFIMEGGSAVGEGTVNGFFPYVSFGELRRIT